MKDVSHVKQQLLDFCNKYVNDKLNKLKIQIKLIQESLLNETKSSAGDKHETGRAMIQLEREKIGKQLLEAEKLKELVGRIDIKNSSKFIRLGSLVVTSQANYFMAISVGEINVENYCFFSVSLDTPIGKLLIGKKKNENVFFKGKEILIQNVF